jgi:hypothetical protein
MSDIINTWINSNYFTLKNKLLKIKSKDWEDIYHDVLIQVLEKSENFILSLILSNDIDRYIMAMFKLNVFSPTAPHHWRNKTLNTIEIDYYIDILEDDEEIETYINDIQLKDIKEALHELDIFFIDKIIFEHYIDKKSNGSYSIKELSSEIETRNTISAQYTYNKVRDKIREKLNEKTRND